jgi:uncharacterized Zn finger protein
MTQTPQITEAYVRELATEQSFDRGYRYYRDRSVFEIARRGNLITAKVEGRDYEPYRVQVALDDSHLVSKASCTCPYDWGGICKHIVATLLVAINESETILEKPTLDALLDGLTADQLRQIILSMAEESPETAEALEKVTTWVHDRSDITAISSSGTMPIDIVAVHRDIYKGFREIGEVDPFRHGYYDEFAGYELDPSEFLEPHLDDVQALLDGGDVETAVILISAIIDAFVDGVQDLDDWIHEYNEDQIYLAGLDLGAALAEVLLSQDMKPDQTAGWLDRIETWEEDIAELAIAKTAIEQGWAYPPLVSAMQGNITERGTWEREAPYFADELTLARLRILARQERTQEYINLAEAEGQGVLAIKMIAQTDDFDTAVTQAKAHLVHPGEILTIAHILADRGELEAALSVAEHGLNQENTTGKTELARWTRERATTAGRLTLAIRAAQEAFFNSHSLADYLAVKELAGDSWKTIRPRLLKKLKQHWSATDKIDIYLHENMLAEAMKALDKEQYISDYDLLRVIEATRETQPDWGIRQCTKHAEAIMDGGRSREYDSAVSWLRIVRDIYIQHERQKEWEAYLDSLLDTHFRKYKLIPMLRNIAI